VNWFESIFVETLGSLPLRLDVRRKLFNLAMVVFKLKFAMTVDRFIFTRNDLGPFKLFKLLWRHSIRWVLQRARAWTALHL